MIHGLLRSLAAFLATIFGVLLGLNAPGAIAAAPESTSAYTYDGHDQTAAVAHTTAERGPASCAYGHLASAVDRSSHGGSACSARPTPRAATTFDDPRGLAQVAQAAGTSREQVRRSDGDLSSIDRARVAANGAEDSVSLFRAVSKGEADDIAGFGFRQAPNGRSYEGKLFATTAEDAARYGRINYGQDSVPFHIVETRVPRSFADQLYTGTADRMTFRAVDPGQLSDLNRLGSTSIWNYVPWVAKP